MFLYFKTKVIISINTTLNIKMFYLYFIFTSPFTIQDIKVKFVILLLCSCVELFHLGVHGQVFAMSVGIISLGTTVLTTPSISSARNKPSSAAINSSIFFCSCSNVLIHADSCLPFSSCRSSAFLHQCFLTFPASASSAPFRRSSFCSFIIA